VTSSSTNVLLEVAAVYTATGIAVYVINKNANAVTFALNQSGRYSLGAGSQISILKRDYERKEKHNKKKGR
jgi:hypothetical protein